ncbi:uncharacterized protein [Macrobrachium rosenbergii]|uniref:uncharacterized protein n=1 Tax=Macrobrachium rosenbergii TaxID=79674 RepID=UPI0034D3CF77
MAPPKQYAGANVVTLQPKATPMEEASTASCAETFLSSWLSCFRVPDSITTDRGPVFLSELWVSLACLMGTALHSTTAYNLAGNGMVERAHRFLKAALMACCTDERWKEQLPWVLLGLRTAPEANGDASPADKVYGETLAIPGEFFPPSADSADTPFPRLRELVQKFAPCHKTFTDRTTTYSPPALHSCAYVFVRVDARRPPFTRPYRGPHRVIRQATKAYFLDIHGREDWITIDRLKTAFVLDRKYAGRRQPPQSTPSVPLCRHTRSPTKAGSRAPQKTHRANPKCWFHPTPTVLQEQGPAPSESASA